MFIDQTRILQETDGGLRIILTYYPQAEPAVSRNGYKFKIRGTEKTASATLRKLDDGNWVVTDFGGDQKPRNAIMICMLEEGIEFKEACQLLGQRFQIGPETIQSEVNKPDIDSRAAKPEENDGEWLFEVRKGFTELDVKTVLADKVIPTEKLDGGGTQINFDKIERVFSRYHFYSLESYTVIKNRKATTISATDQYPIFMWDEGNFKKIYQPLSPDKGRRFMYYGKRDTHYLHGFTAANQAYEAQDHAPKKDIAPDDDSEGETIVKKVKLPELIYCSGGSDGMNLAMLGYQVVWPNSETSKLSSSQLKKLNGIAEKIFNMADIDTTGKREAHRLAMEHLDLHTIELPESLGDRYDNRGKPCKDVRDYLKYHNYYDFKQLIKTALPYQFWEVEYVKSKYSDKWKENYTVLNTELYNFLAKNGFYRLELQNEKDGYIFIKITDNVVKRIKPSVVKDFINTFLEERQFSPRLRDAFYRSTQINETSLQNLPLIDINFTSFDRESQYFFFKNKTALVTKTKIGEFKPGEVQKYVWDNEVINHSFKQQDPHFKIFKGEDDQWDIEVLKTDNIFLNFLINTSRIHWRKEFEDCLDGKTAEEIANYKKKHQFDIAGPNLAPEEIREQKLHLINKIYTIGFLLHKYKDKSKNWAAFGMDARLSDSGESHGGTGKSLIYDAPNLFLSNEYLGGRDPKLTENKHLYEGITKHTFYVLVDDCAEYLNFQYFFDAVTGKLKVNPKNTTHYTLDFKDVPKFAFTSNFSLRNQDSSTRRRLLFTVNSDFYHHNKDGFYREDHSPRDDFDMELLTEDMNEDQWNDFTNFMLQACQLYMNNDKINPPMDEVEKRNLLSEMGPAFHEWADIYFINDEESKVKRLNEFVSKVPAFEDYRKSTSSRWTSQKFMKAMKSWCKYYGYVLNPKDLRNDKNRIMKRMPVPGLQTLESMEVLFIQTGDDSANIETDPF